MSAASLPASMPTSGKPSFFTHDKGFFQNFFALFRVIVLQNVIVLGVGLADNIMVGAYSETALSGVAAVNSIQFFFQQLILGTGDALVTLGSQYWGQKRTGPIKSVGAGALMLGVTFGLVLFVLTSLIPEKIVGLFTDSPAIIAEGVKYLSIVRFTYPLFAFTNVLLALLRSVETVRISFVVSSIAFVLNVGINYTLIGGHFGAPALGVRGAAIGTLVSRIVELMIVLVYLLAIDKRLMVRPFRKPTDAEEHLSPVLIGDYFRHAVFFVVTAGMFGASCGIQNVVLGHMADSAIAANSIAQTLYQILKVASVGAASATSIIIGKTVGKGDLDRLHEYVRTLQVMFLGVGLLTSLVLFLLRTPILSLYTLSDETTAMARTFIGILCVTCIGTAYEMPVITGIIRGGGDATFVFKNDLISIWCIVLPLSILAALRGFPPAVVFALLNSDQVFKCGAAFIKVNRYRWIKKLTR